jgi:hypothetical protein
MRRASRGISGGPSTLSSAVHGRVCGVDFHSALWHTISVVGTQTRGHVWVGQRLDGSLFDVFIPLRADPTLATVTMKALTTDIPFGELLSLAAWILGHAPQSVCRGCQRLPDPSRYCARCGASALTVWDHERIECRACGHVWVR